jgi:hypothetical protein
MVSVLGTAGLLDRSLVVYRARVTAASRRRHNRVSTTAEGRFAILDYLAPIQNAGRFRRLRPRSSWERVMSLKIVSRK